jgi:aspartate/methionine/tyrosine aminotransferase
MRLASRLDHIEPFYVMECAKAAEALARSPACDPAAGGEPMIFLNIGEPDFTAPPLVLAAAERCLRSGRTQYTQATGDPALREAIAGWYGSRFGVVVDPARIVVTAGASAALQLVCLALFEAGDEVLMPDPSYPCNRHFVAAAGARARLLPAGPAARFQLDAASVAAAWTPATRGVLLASPSNPTGTSIAHAEMRAIAQAVRARGGVTIVDEIYLGLSYDEAYGRSALDLDDGLGEQIVSVNSFSKYFSMTGWRWAGWCCRRRWCRRSRSWRRTSTSARAASPSRPRWPASSRRRSSNTSAGAPSSASGATSSCRRSRRSACRCRCGPTAPSTPGPTSRASAPAAGTSPSRRCGARMSR